MVRNVVATLVAASCVMIKSDMSHLQRSFPVSTFALVSLMFILPKFGRAKNFVKVETIFFPRPWPRDGWIISFIFDLCNEAQHPASRAHTALAKAFTSLWPKLTSVAPSALLVCFDLRSDAQFAKIQQLDPACPSPHFSQAGSGTFHGARGLGVDSLVGDQWRTRSAITDL